MQIKWTSINVILKSRDGFFTSAEEILYIRPHWSLKKMFRWRMCTLSVADLHVHRQIFDAATRLNFIHFPCSLQGNLAE